MKRLLVLFIGTLIVCHIYSSDPVTPVPMAKYLEFARASADWTWDHYDSLEIAWRRSLDPDNIFGYRPPSRFLKWKQMPIFSILSKLVKNFHSPWLM